MSDRSWLGEGLLLQLKMEQSRVMHFGLGQQFELGWVQIWELSSMTQYTDSRIPHEEVTYTHKYTVYPTWEELDMKLAIRGKKTQWSPSCAASRTFSWPCVRHDMKLLFSSLTAPLHPPHLLHISLFSQGCGCKSCFYQNVRLLNYSVSLSEEHPAVCIYTQPCLLIQSPFQQPPWRVKWRLITTKGEHSQFYNQTGLTLWHCLQSRLTRLQQG